MANTTNESVRRINYIDFLKFIGLTGIIIAHSEAPSWLLILRSFDVPLMVILSSILGGKSFERHIGNGLSTTDYYVKRIKRLVIPTWLFLLIFFAMYYITSGNLFDYKYYIASFSLTRYGIGYVWVILVYMYSALLIPLFSKIKSSKAGLLCIVAVYILFEALYYFKVGVDNPVIDTTFYYIVPYGVLTYLGYNYSHMKKSYKIYITTAMFIAFVGMGIYYWVKFGTPQFVQIAKYPPRIYYLSSGVMASFLLIQICEKINLRIYNNRIIKFISAHSLWIYLWHILVLTLYSVAGLPKVWYVKLLVVYFASVIIVIVVNNTLDIIEKKKSFKIFTYFRG